MLYPLAGLCRHEILNPSAEVVSDPMPNRTPRCANRRAGATALPFQTLASGFVSCGRVCLDNQFYLDFRYKGGVMQQNVTGPKHTMAVQQFGGSHAIT